MKMTMRAMLVVASVIFLLPSPGNSANVEWLGILSGFGGAERETILTPTQFGGCASVGCFSVPRQTGVGQMGGRGTIQGLGVIPLAGPLGAQVSLQYTGGSGSRFGTTFGPLFDFTAGKLGLFATYQHRTPDQNYWWLEPAVDYYMGDINLSLRYIQPISSVQDRVVGVVNDLNHILQRNMAINRLQATASYFPPDFLSLGKDNFEVTAGIQVNSFAGPRVDGAGVGPVFGLAIAPAQNVEVTLVKGTVDNRSRFDIQSGIRFYFGQGSPSTSPAKSPSLKELRRKYIEASPYPVSGHSAYRQGKS